MKKLFKSPTLLLLVLVMVGEFALAASLSLPEGWPRYIAALIILATFLAMCRAGFAAYNRPGLWLLLLCAAAATACNRSTAPAWAYSQHAKEYRAKEAEAHERAIVYTAPPFGCDSSGWCGRVTW